MQNQIMKKLKLLFVSIAFVIGISAVTIENDRLFEISKNMELFASVFKMLNIHYVDEVDPNSLMKIGIDAMVGSLDPYTNYVTESQVQSYRISDDDKFQGVGCSVIKIGESFFIDNMLEAGPAQVAGIKEGDEITSINNVKPEGKSANEVMSLLRGAEGSVVNLGIKSSETKKEINHPLKRDEVNISNVPYSNIVAPNIGYIQLTTFTANAGGNISKALSKLKEQDPNLKGLMLDLRQNGGGLLREAIIISNLFIDKGKEVVTTKGKLRDKDQIYRTTGPAVDLDIPITVLVDNRSASASEIVSGVLQDYDRAVILGQRTYGKGLVQNFFELGYNSRVKVTISKYYIPSGRCIQGVEYANGDPVDIPDNKRTKFKTKNGRVVLDGGGVTPDIKIEKPEKSSLMKSIEDQQMIFQYVNHYLENNPKLNGKIEDFKFTNFEDFTKWLNKKKFDYKIEGESDLDKLNSAISANSDLKLSTKSNIEALQSSFKVQKAKDMQKHSAEIIDEIEKEIAARYGYEKAKAQVSLRNDIEVKEAISVLNDPARYKSLLAIKS
jgi:carboxyl-terminal processing protease